MDDQRPDNLPNDELAYIKYSAKEILFHLTSKIETLQGQVNQITLDMTTIKLNMVTRDELTNTRRWATGAVIASVSALIAGFTFFGA